MKAYNLQRIDIEHDMHLQAWLNHQVTATKNVGTDKKPKQVPVYKKFEYFFDYKKRIEELQKIHMQKKITPQMKRMARVAFLVNSGKEVRDG